jgi:hypothetical protein
VHVALPWLIPETDDIAVAIAFFLFVAPMTIAATVATRLVQMRAAPRPRSAAGSDRRPLPHAGT